MYIHDVYTRRSSFKVWIRVAYIYMYMCDFLFLFLYNIILINVPPSSVLTQHIQCTCMYNAIHKHGTYTPCVCMHIVTLCV